MRRLFAPLLSLATIAGCAGNVADYVGPASSITAPQMIRYGLALDQGRCLSEKLGASLTPLQLRRFVRIAAVVHQGYFDPDHLTARDLAYVAAHVGDDRIGAAFDSAVAECHVALETVTAAAALQTIALPPDAPARPAPATWLNLGAGGSGQTIAINASTIEQDGPMRTAWFRMSSPNADHPDNDIFLLNIDCAHHTINARSRRRLDASGGVTEQRDYPDNPLPVEGGTVMEIAFLSTCT
jgi:hypothetical protein